MKVKQFAFVLPLCILAACTVHLDEPITQDKQEGNVALDTAFITPVVDPNSLVPGDPAAKVFEIQSGTITEKADIDFNNQRLENKVATLNSLKVDRAGDTMTGKLTVFPSAATQALQATAGAGSDQSAIQATGDGIGPGIIATGGTNGVGATFTAGGGNNFGVRGIGSGTGEGVLGQGAGGPGGSFVATSGDANGATCQGNGAGFGVQAIGGVSGPGLVASSATSPTATVPTKGAEISGFVEISGTQPNSNIDPGANNALHGTNISKAWVVIDTSYNVLDGYNIASITNITGSIYRLDFVRPMANANYGVVIQQHGAPGGSGAHNATKDVSGFRFVLYDTADKSLGFAAGCTEAYIEVKGRQ